MAFLSENALSLLFPQKYGIISSESHLHFGLLGITVRSSMRMRNAPLRTTCRTLTLEHQTGSLWQKRKKKKNFPNLPFTCLCCKTLSVSCSPSIFQALYLSLLHVHREEPGLPTAASLHCTSSSLLLVGRKTLCIIPVNSIQSGSVAEMIFMF